MAISADCIIMNDLVQLLQDYLTSDKSLDECAEWLAGVDWDDPDLSATEKETLGLFELLLAEVSEGWRGEPEFRDAAADFLSGETNAASGKGIFTEISAP